MISLLLAATLLGPMKPLSVTTFNVRYGTADDGDNRWSIRKPFALAIVKEHQPDILCVQEALDFQVAEFAEAFEYGTIGVGRDDGRKAGEFSAILYDRKRLRVLDSGTFWLSDTPETVGSKSWGNNVLRICSWAQFEDLASHTKFKLYNTHLDHESQPSREKSVALIVKRIAGYSPTIVTGDFNSGEKNPVVSAMKAAGFRDTWRILNPDRPEPGTFSGFKELGKEKIDYIWADKAWNVRAAAIISNKVAGHWPSDHVPVTARLELAP